MLKSIIAIIFGLTLLTACGGAGDSKTESTPETSQESATPQSNEVSLEIHGNDQMQFDKTEFTVKAGSTVTLTLKHPGTAAKNVMGHNWVLLKQGVDIATFATAANAAGLDNDYIPVGTTDVIAHTKVIGGGETTSITFTAPAAGTYDFICSFPGHWAMMKGKFIVE